MNLTPLTDYLSFLNGKYGFAMLAAAAALSIVGALGGNADERSRVGGALALGATAATLLLYAGFLIFIFYQSQTGHRYDFWPLTCSIFIMVYGFSSAVVLINESFSDARTYVVLGFFASLIFSPMVAAMVRAFENLHPLWP